MRRRVASARVGRLATVTADGHPHLVPCCFVLCGDVVYSAVDAKPKSTSALRRIANVRANPVASLLVDRYAEDWSQLWWIRLDGDGHVVVDDDERDRALRLLTVKYEQYHGHRPPGPVLAVEVTGWRAWAFADDDSAASAT